MRILKEFLDGTLHLKRDARYPIIFGLATNFRYLEGGIEWMEATMRATDEKHLLEGDMDGVYEPHHYAVLKALSRKYLHYYPSSLASFSPYPDDHKYRNIIEASGQLSTIIKLNQTRKVMSLSAAETLLKETFFKALDTPGVHVIKTVTGLGKTELLKSLPLNQGKSYAIAFPTHALKEEVAQRLGNIDFTISPDLPDLPESIKLRMEYFLNTGAVTAAYSLLRDYRQELLTEGNTEAASEIDKFYDELKQADEAHLLITTHTKALVSEYRRARVVNKRALRDRLKWLNFASFDWVDFSEEIADIENKLNQPAIALQHVNKLDKKDVVIFDEDPLQELLSVGYVTREDLFRLQPYVSGELALVVSDLLNMFNHASSVQPTPNWSISEADIATVSAAIAKHDTRYFEGNLLGILGKNCRFIGKAPVGSQDEGKLFFIQVKQLPQAKTVIILDATADETIYGQLLPEATFTDISDVETVGRLIQDYSISASRASLNHPASLEKVKALVAEFKPDSVITFQKYRHNFDESDKLAYFFNCSGYDHLRGKRLAVVGTPHNKPIVYSLMANAMGFEVDTTDYLMANHWITRNGFEFQFHTFHNEAMRAIQLYCIEKELTQAVGRARIVRENTEVLLISNFPLRSTENVTVVTTDIELNAIAA